jgi:hypothetical protein
VPSTSTARKAAPLSQAMEEKTNPLYLHGSHTHTPCGVDQASGVLGLCTGGARPGPAIELIDLLCVLLSSS